MVKRWVPLEANPDVLNRYSALLGADTAKLAFCDVYGLDEELLAMLPQPVHALLLLFPVTDAIDEADAAVDRERAEAGERIDPGVFYMHQTVSNACGTIGLLHALGNNTQAANISQGSFLQRFFEATAGMSPAERGKFLEEPPEGAPDIEDLHEAAAQEGDSAPPDVMDVTPHFVALINHNGRLLELDGRKKFPVDHGQTSADTLLQDAAVVARRFMDQQADSIRFNLIALTAPA